MHGNHLLSFLSFLAPRARQRWRSCHSWGAHIDGRGRCGIPRGREGHCHNARRRNIVSFATAAQHGSGSSGGSDADVYLSAFVAVLHGLAPAKGRRQRTRERSAGCRQPRFGPRPVPAVPRSGQADLARKGGAGHDHQFVSLGRAVRAGKSSSAATGRGCLDEGLPASACRRRPGRAAAQARGHGRSGSGRRRAGLPSGSGPKSVGVATGRGVVGAGKKRVTSRNGRDHAGQTGKSPMTSS